MALFRLLGGRNIIIIIPVGDISQTSSRDPRLWEVSHSARFEPETRRTFLTKEELAANSPILVSVLLPSMGGIQNKFLLTRSRSLVIGPHFIPKPQILFSQFLIWRQEEKAERRKGFFLLPAPLLRPPSLTLGVTQILIDREKADRDSKNAHSGHGGGGRGNFVHGFCEIKDFFREQRVEERGGRGDILFPLPASKIRGEGDRGEGERGKQKLDHETRGGGRTFFPVPSPEQNTKCDASRKRLEIIGDWGGGGGFNSD